MSDEDKKLENPEKQEVSRLPNGQFPPGVSGNPGGRATGSISLKAMIRQKIAEVPIGQTKAWAEQLVDSLLEKAVKDKDVAAHKLIMSYVDDLPTQPLANADGQPLVVRLVQFDGNTDTPQPEAK